MDSGGSGTRTAGPRGWWTPADDRTRRDHRRSDLVIGIVMVGLWATWLVLTALTQPRLVTADHLRADLAAGRVVTWQTGTLEHTHDQEGWAADLPWASTGGDSGRDPSDGDGPGPLGVAYRVDGFGPPLRIVTDDRAPVDLDALVSRLQAAGVPSAHEAGDWTMTVRPEANRPVAAAAPLLLLALGSILIGPGPTRGTRWFWFWLLWVTLGLGVLAYAVLEQVRPAPMPDGPGVRRRPWRGGWGLVLMLFVGPLVALAVTEAADATHWLWVVRPG